QIEKDIDGPNNGVQFLRTSLEELKTILLKQLDNGTIRMPSKEPVTHPMLRVYVVCERNDLDAVRPIEMVLKGRGFDVDLPLFKGDPSEISKDHRETLVDCDAVLIYHKNGSEGWLREKIRDCRRAPAWGRTKSFLSRGIYIGSEPNESKQGLQNDEFI